MPPPVEDEEAAARAEGQGVIFVLDDAQLEVAQVGKVRTQILCLVCRCKKRPPRAMRGTAAPVPVTPPRVLAQHTSCSAASLPPDLPIVK